MIKKMKPTACLLENASIVNEGSIFRGDVFLDQGVIRKIFPGGHRGAFTDEECRKIDVDGKFLLPGVIDDQVHFREPGLTHKADLHSESLAAIAGGITSFMEMPNTIPQTTTQALLEKKFQTAQQKSLANYSFYIGATNNNLDELKATDPANVCGIKVFMGASTGNMLVDDPDALERIFREVSLLVAVHCEDESTIRENLAVARQNYGQNIPVHHHPAIRDHEACERSSRLAMALAENYGTRLHVLHVSTANEVRLLNNDIPLDNKQITAEVCVHHLWFHMDDYAKKGALIKWNPSIKFETDRRALIQGIQNAYIDVVATDHAPHTLAEKEKLYAECPSGAPMVQHALPAMITLGKKYGLGLEKIVELMCHNPAICFKVKNRGFIREGYAADLVVIDPDSPWKVSKDNVLYKCGWSPLEGSVLQASVEYTFVNGHLVYEQGRFHESIKGQALAFNH